MDLAILQRRPVAAVIVLNLLLSLPGLWIPYYNIDELTNAVYARFILDGELGLKDFLGNTYILTHYLYVLIGKIFGLASLAPMHAVHALWKCFSIAAAAWAGEKLADRKTGAWCALFYCLASVSFLSKDFHTPSAESFSLLPAFLAAGFFARAMPHENARDYCLAGVCAGIATLFKAPMGITIIAFTITLAARGRGFFRSVILSHGAFAVTLITPALFVWPWPEGFRLMATKIGQTNAQYIGAFEGLSYLYVLAKYLIRSALIAGALLAMTIFAVYNCRTLFSLRRTHPAPWLKNLFLVCWAALLGYAIALGGRVFFHYYVFLLAPLSLLAGCGLASFDARLAVALHRPLSVTASPSLGMRFARRYVVILLMIPAIGFSIEGAFNVSTRAPRIADAVGFIRKNTALTDGIYVWGEVPGLYFFSGRQPATTHFWSEFLAGTSPGTAAMEYARATGNALTLAEQVVKDLTGNAFKKQQPDKLDADSAIAGIGENELFTLKEILNRTEHPYWKKVFTDFFANPPKLFIDTSPTNIRGFGHTPISKYELLKRFVLDNYHVAAIRDDMVIYELNGAGDGT